MSICYHSAIDSATLSKNCVKCNRNPDILRSVIMSTKFTLSVEEFGRNSVLGIKVPSARLIVLSVFL